MAGFSCPRCGAIIKNGNSCEYCGFVYAGEPADKAKEQAGTKNSPDGGKQASKITSSKAGIILLAIAAIIIAVAIWYKVDPYSVPIWIQQIVIDIRKFFGDTSWTYYSNTPLF